MNINVSLPSIVPNQLQPQTESAQTDNRRVELVPPSRQGEASNAESGVGSQKERSRAAQANPGTPAPATKESGQGVPATVTHRFVEAAGEEGEHRQRQDADQQEQQQQKQQRQVALLVERDLEVRRHEQAHQAAGGEHAGSPTYQFSRGPDGKRYATGGEVAIDIGAIPGDPAATIAKMQQVRAAALAPDEPSSQDLSVARAASAKEAQARTDLMALRQETMGPLGVYMDKRNQVIAQHYQQSARPAPPHSLSQDV